MCLIVDNQNNKNKLEYKAMFLNKVDFKNVNKNFGKITKFNIIKYAPIGKSDKELLADGWLPVVDNSPKEKAEDGFIYIIVGWQEVDGHLEKKFEKRKQQPLPNKRDNIMHSDRKRKSNSLNWLNAKKIHKLNNKTEIKD